MHKSKLAITLLLLVVITFIATNEL